MKLLQNKAAELLNNGTVKLIIAYKSAINKKPVPCFAETAEQAAQLIFTPECLGNLAVYLHKPEVKAAGKVAIVANIATMRSMVQLFAENQIQDSQFLVLTVHTDGQLILMERMQEVETWVQNNFPDYSDEDKALLEQLSAMSRQERWQFWTEQFSACVKCYACRAVCPMCYCASCTVECNQPQWIKVSAQTTGNMEWHTMRAMHLAGRCINCGECGRICPVNIPVHLLTAKMNKDIEAEFGSRSGFSLKSTYALNTFKPADKDGFIK